MQNSSVVEFVNADGKLLLMLLIKPVLFLQVKKVYSDDWFQHDILLIKMSRQILISQINSEYNFYFYIMMYTMEINATDSVIEHDFTVQQQSWLHECNLKYNINVVMKLDCTKPHLKCSSWT